MYENLRLKISEVHDTHQKQKDNRTLIKEVSKDVTNEKLNGLLYDYEHYFDKGHFIDKTPEEMKQSIMDEIDTLTKAELDKVS